MGLISIIGSTKVHRSAAAVVGALTTVTAAISVYGSGFGLDAHTISLVVGAITVAVAVAREVENPSLFAFLVKATPPTPQVAPTPPTPPASGQ